MLKKISLALCAMFVLALPAAEFRVKGKVSAPDMTGVAICDGEKFYPVNKDGSFDFTFSYQGTGFVYVDYPSSLKPAGIWSTDLKPGNNELSFKLVKQEAIPATFNFIHGSDVQYNFVARRGELQNDMKEIAALMKDFNARFITFPGDISEFGDMQNLSIVKEEMAKNLTNYFPIFGGHDRIKSTPSYKHFGATFGAPYFGWHFGGIYFFSPVSEYMSIKEVYSRQRQVNWMKNALDRLAPGTPVMVVTHQPWYVFNLIESYAKAGKIKLFGFLGAHTHYHNLYEYNGYPVLAVEPLRNHDTGSFTKRIRLVTINREKGIVSTKTRLLNQKQRAEATVSNGDQLLLRVADITSEATAVSVEVNGKVTRLKKLNSLVWGATLPEKITAPKGVTATVHVKNNGGQWQKKIKLVNTPKLAWTAVLPFIQRSYPTVAVQGNILVAGIESGELPAGKGGVAAFDRHSGKLLWQYSGADVASGVAADKDTVRALDVNTNLLTLDINTGKLLRKTPVKRGSMYTRTHAQVEIVDGKVLFAMTSDGVCKLFCYDANNDKPVWKKPINLGSAWCSVNFTVKDGIIYYIGAGCNGAARLADGVDIWRRKDARKTSLHKPLVIGEHVYYYLRAILVKINAATGELIWADKKVPGSSSTIGGVAVKDGRVLGVATNALIVDSDADGKRIYRYNLQPLHKSRGISYQALATTTAPVFWNDMILVLGDDGAVYNAAEYLKTAGKGKNVIPPRKIFETGFSFKGSPAIAGDMAYFVGFDGVIYAMKY